MKNLAVFILIFASFSFSASAQSAKTQFEQGVALYDEENFAAAAAAFAKAAEKGYVDAQFNLGLMTLKGEGVEQDYPEAMRLFRLAAEQGSVKAQTNLARMYAKAKGVAPNYGQAVFWFRKAADAGYDDAQYSLGVLYASGIGVPRDLRKAWELFNAASEQNNLSAHYQLGLMYFKGKGVAENKVEGLKFLTLAGDFEESALYLKYAQGKSSAEEIAEANKMVAEWRADHPAKP